MHRRLFYALLILLPSQFGKHFWPDFSFISGVRVDYLSPTLYLTDLLIIFILSIYLKEQQTVVKKEMTRNRKLLAYSTGIMFLFLIISPQPILTCFVLVRLLEGLYLIWYINSARISIVTSILCLIAGGIWTSTIGWWQLISQSSIGGFLYFLGERTFSVVTPGIATVALASRFILRPYATFSHPNTFAGYILILTPLLFSSELKKVKWFRFIHIPLLVGLVITILTTFSRSAWIVGVFLIAACIVFIILKKGHGVVVQLGIITALVTIGFMGIEPLRQRLVLTNQFDQTNLAIRTSLIKASMAMTRDHPIGGVGLGNFLPTLPSYLTIHSIQELQPVHTIYLLYVSETGLLGLVALSILVVGYSKHIQQIKQNLKGKRGRSAAAPFMIAIGIWLLLGLFDHYPVSQQQTRLLMCIVIGLLFKQIQLLSGQKVSA